MKRLLMLVGSCASIAFLALSTVAVAGTIEGTVTLGAPEKPLQFVEVQFFDAASAELLATSITGEKGNYSSGNVSEGNYRIRYSDDDAKLLPEFSGSNGKDFFCFATPYFVGAKDTLIVDEAMVPDVVSQKVTEYFFYGVVKDAITDRAIEGVFVEFRDSQNGLLIDTLIKGNTRTDVNGAYEAQLESTLSGVSLRFVDPSGKYFPEYAALTARSDDFCSGTVYEGGYKHEVNATLDLVPADQQVQVIIDTIDDLALSNNVQNSLGTPLVRAVDLLTDANHMNDQAVCAQLSAFISRIDIQERQGRISTEDADKLRQSAKISSVALGC